MSESGVLSIDLHNHLLNAITYQVALRVFRNKTAAQADEVDKPYNPKSKPSGRSDLLTRCGITEMTPRMIAYAAVHVLALHISLISDALTMSFIHRHMSDSPP